MTQLNTTVSIVDYLKNQGKPSDYTSRGGLYKQLNLESKYGSYLGSGQQNTAMLNLLEAQKNQPIAPIAPTGEQADIATRQAILTPEEQKQWGATPQQGIVNTQKQIADIQKQILEKQNLIEQSKKLGYPSNENLVLSPDLTTVLPRPIIPPTEPPPTEPPPSVSIAPTKEFVEMTGDDYQKMTQDILDKVGTTDLPALIKDFAGGTLTTPELELNKEARDQALNDLKTAAAKGLSNIQKSLAQRGMTFSGIRTEEEASHAADVLSAESGINRDFAGRIISAARQEQQRRETALSAAETSYNKALEAQGYVYNPITNTIEKTLEAKKYETEQQKYTYEQKTEAERYALEQQQEQSKFALDVYKATQPEKVDTQVVETNGRKLLVNTQTGETIKDLGKAGTATTQETINQRILSQINSAIDQYKINPEGFRETFINSLVSTYGEENRKYIKEQVYALMPDIKEKIPVEKGFTSTTIPSQVKFDLLDDIQKGASLLDLYGAYPDVSPSLIQNLYYNH